MFVHEHAIRRPQQAVGGLAGPLMESPAPPIEPKLNRVPE